MVIICFTYSPVQSQTPDSLDVYIKNSMHNHYIPGLSAVIIKQGKIVYANGFGFANIENNFPFTPNTVNAEIASISKTITATALMQLWEQHKFNLDEAINNYLPFKVTNPYFPDVPITFRMLLAHTSSLSTKYEATYDNFNFVKNPLPTLGKFLFDFLDPEGSLYVDSLCFHKYKPGKKWSYNGTGYALIGYLVEQISGKPFDEYCNANIFEPLCMNQTAWHFNKLDTNIISHPYQYSFEKDNFDKIGFYEYPSYPEGQLKSNAIDLAKFLWMSFNGGSIGDTHILKSETINLMHTIQIAIADTNYVKAYYGLGWATTKINGLDYWGHPGRDYCIATNMAYRPADSIGVILLTNGEDDASGMQWCTNADDIICKLFEVAETLPTKNCPNINCALVTNTCVHDKSFWVNNSSTFPSNVFPVKLGKTKICNRKDLFAILNTDENKNGQLIQQLATARLNIANSAAFANIVETVLSADSILNNYSIDDFQNQVFKPLEIKKIKSVIEKLSQYNTGKLNSDECNENFFHTKTEGTTNANKNH